MKNYIVGHKNPDTDSVVSAIAYARIKEKLQEDEEFVASVAGDINKETLFVLNKFELEVPGMIPKSEKHVILVDHNEPAHISENVDLGEIKAIFDHHKLGGLSTLHPITLIMRPVGSTCTILAQESFSKSIEIDKITASLLLAGILSDTLKLTSPTTTEDDKNILQELNNIAQVDIDKFATEMFNAKSDISDIPTLELLSKDYKVFDMNGKKVGIGVWETVNTKVILDRKDEILEKLIELKEKDSLDLVYFAAVDILKGSSELFVVNSEADIIAKAAFGLEAIDSIMHLDGVVSRKKQIVPKIEEALK